MSWHFSGSVALLQMIIETLLRGVSEVIATIFRGQIRIVCIQGRRYSLILNETEVFQL